MYEISDDTTLRFRKNSGETWCHIAVANQPQRMFIRMVSIEKQAMQQEVTIDAGAMARVIGESGRVAIYGIYFDTCRAELKPESSAAMAEIAKMLKQSPALRVKWSVTAERSPIWPPT